jgi:two-component system sensor kinase FixL
VRRTAEDQLAHLELKLAHVARLSTMGELVASIAHEVNQPLFSIVNFAKASARQLNRDEPPDADALRELNDQIAECAVRAGAIIKRLREFVSRGDPLREPADVNRLVQGVCDMMSFSLRRSGVRLDLDLAPELPQVVVDGVQIQQVLVNLLQNACEALEDVSRNERRIIIRTRHMGEFVSVVVADTGPGLPDESGINLFDSFVTTKPEGLGMGLAISRTIVEAHGGRLMAGAGEEGGAEFLFTLPIQR